MLEEKVKGYEDKFIIYRSQFGRAYFKNSLTFLVKLSLSLLLTIYYQKIHARPLSVYC